MKTISKSEAIEQITSQMTGPMELVEFTNRVLALGPRRQKIHKPVYDRPSDTNI